MMIRKNIYTAFFRPGFSLIGVFLLFQIMFSCEYDIDEIYVNEIEDTGVEYPKVELDFSDSLIVIYEKTSFSYKVNLEKQSFHTIEIHLDGNKVFSNNASFGEFTLNPSDGQHTLEMFIHTSTGSGTIRNKLGGEHWLFSNSWILMMERPSVDPGDPHYENVKFTFTGIKENDLVLEWEPYEGYRFDYYEITTVENYNRYRVYDLNAASIKDPYHVGGKETYYLNVVRTDNAVVRCDTVTINYSNPISYTIDSDYNITFSWPPCRVPGNFQSYDLYYGSSFNTGGRIFHSNEVLDTTFTRPFGLFHESQYVLKITAKEGSNGAGDYEIVKLVNSGTRMDTYSSISQTMFPPYLVYTNKEILDVVQGKSTPYNNYYSSNVFGISPDNKILVSRRYRMDPESPGVWRNMVSLHEEYPVARQSRVSFSLGEMGIFSGSYTDFIYNFRTDSIWRYLPKDGYDRHLLSPNGDYIVAYDKGEMRVYTLEGKTISKKGSLHYSDIYEFPYYYYYEFLPDSLSSTLAFVSEGKLQLWSCERLELVNEVATDADHLVKIDPVTRSILCVTGNQFLIYDLDDLELIKQVRVDEQFVNQQSWSPNSVGYMGGTLFISGSSTRSYSFDILQAG